VSEQPLEDYYEALQVSPNADTETIARVFRHLAKRYHPDNPASGDAARFELLARAHRVLCDPEKRASYDARHRESWNRQWKIADEARDGGGFAEDRRVRHRLLSLFYVKRRRDLRSPGLGNLEMTRLLDCPPELLDFHVWYLREKGWLVRLETGQFAITADGVDQVEQNTLDVSPDRLLEAGAPQDGAAEEGRIHQLESAVRLNRNAGRAA